MCDPDAGPCPGWKGWRKLPPVASFTASGAWHDCSHPLTADVPRVPLFPKPVFEQVMRMPERAINVTRMEMIVHIGTHIDSPRHFFLDGPALDEVPLERLAGRGVVWPVEAGEAEVIEPSHLAGLEERLSPGDILFLNTGWHRFAGTSRYDNDHPVLSRATAEWVVARGVKLLGVDIPTPDQALARRKPDFDYPVHRTLLGNGVLIAEHLTGLDPLNGKSVEIACFGLNIVGGDGSPTRIVAREIAAS
jgi:kynurenine formamidase